MLHRRVRGALLDPRHPRPVRRGPRLTVGGVGRAEHIFVLFLLLFNCFKLGIYTTAFYYWPLQKRGKRQIKAVKHSSLNCDLYGQEEPSNFLYPRHPFPILNGSILNKAILITGENSECPLFNPQWVPHFHCVLS